MTKQLKEMEIPFGAKDSELCGWEYSIPEGYEAEIKDGKVVVKKKESEDERIIERIKKAVESYWSDEPLDEILAYLEKQGEQTPAWSEEDEERYRKIVRYIKSKGYEDDSDWLKSLKDRFCPQNAWKPSESDILLLERIANGKSNPQDFQASLYALIGQLKNLREE